MASRRNRRSRPRFPHLHQGAADDSGGRRDSLAQRHAAADARSVRLRAAGALFPGRRFSREASRADGRHHLPRKYRRCLHRDRVEIRHARSEKAARLPEQGNAGRRAEADSRRFRRGHQADFPVRNQAADAPRDSVRAREQEARRDHHAQGQHHEIYRRRVPRLGLRTGRGRIPRRRSSPSAKAGSSAIATRTRNITIEQNAAHDRAGTRAGYRSVPQIRAATK